MDREDINGFEFVARMKEKGIWESTPTLIVTMAEATIKTITGRKKYPLNLMFKNWKDVKSYKSSTTRNSQNYEQVFNVAGYLQLPFNGDMLLAKVKGLIEERIESKSILDSAIFDCYSEKLNMRFEKGVDCTEDDLRFLFLICAQSNLQIPESEIELEKSHPEMKGAKIDVFVAETDYSPSLVLEFKYDRKTSSGANRPRTKQAGAIASDLIRLSKYPSAHNQKKLFLYVTDEEMQKYLANPENEMHALFGLPVGAELDIPPVNWENRPESFREQIQVQHSTFRVKCIFRENLRSENLLLAFQVS
jgi:hypothetical protein